MRGRRELLASVGAISTVAIAGCSGGGADDTGSEGDGQDGEGGTATSNDESGGNTSSDGDDEDSESGTAENTTSQTPTSVVRQFWEAIIAGEYERANELLHPGSLNYPLDESNVAISGQAVESVEVVTYEEASEIIALASEDDLDQAVQDATGVAEYTLVHVSLTESDGITPVVEQDGELLAVWLR
ncbi:hypothetical protein EXE43_21920 [Halorubrum sp. SS5]|uniref:hypothetical protein n=1 Tax=Halorubrum sp. SS7 TaxID=2518119 RepID=UPI0010F50E0D|nr:hypothetical protein [Halorubrum sp. SS7]TKX52385.1 hypothetical protein EXE42_16390 [Halorubrum sp. SP3]TKX56583.1 hypothetical protein EXE44_14480 [Halorubrum sp. SS7]TKX83879.1 hypothetical protein EXE43_21920 [Halorubrum sp. SS5]